jgi:hypothetical protein
MAFAFIPCMSRQVKMSIKVMPMLAARFGGAALIIKLPLKAGAETLALGFDFKLLSRGLLLAEAVALMLAVVAGRCLCVRVLFIEAGRRLRLRRVCVWAVRRACVHTSVNQERACLRVYSSVNLRIAHRRLFQPIGRRRITALAGALRGTAGTGVLKR